MANLCFVGAVDVAEPIDAVDFSDEVGYAFGDQCFPAVILKHLLPDQRGGVELPFKERDALDFVACLHEKPLRQRLITVDYLEFWCVAF